MNAFQKEKIEQARALAEMLMCHLNPEDKPMDFAGAGALAIFEALDMALSNIAKREKDAE